MPQTPCEIDDAAVAEEQTDPDAGNGVDRGEDQQVGQVPREHVR